MNRLDRIIIEPGASFPLGITEYGKRKVQISVWKPHCSDCVLRLYNGKKKHDIKMFSMEKCGMVDIFSVMLISEDIKSILDKAEYEFVCDGEAYADPYAKALSYSAAFGKKKKTCRSKFVFDDFDWGDENWKKLSMDETIMYQCHVRGFTKHSSSNVKNPGTFLGVAEKIPYLKELGVNTLLLMPVYEFDECIIDEKTAISSDSTKVNYWGYTNKAFYFAPKKSYSVEDACYEFASLVKQLHQNGMNVILDFFFGDKTPDYILSCLRYYAVHFHVDGFRINQECMDTSWLRNDPILAHTKIFGNGWSNQPQDNGAEVFYEMNDGFMIDARRFLKSDEGQVEAFYNRFREQRDGIGVVHYITSHNGFTLRDLVSYDVKHNDANGEKNQDGTEYNYSWNCGVEGPSRRKSVVALRTKQEKNALVMLLLGMAVPMILAGDEYGNTQKGNNNAYCQDNNTTWLDWRLLEKNKETFDFVKRLIEFRKANNIYHQKSKLIGADVKGKGAPDISCHCKEPWVTDFSYYSRELGILYFGEYFDTKSMFVAFNLHWDKREFFLPSVSKDGEWQPVIMTAEETDKKVIDGKYEMEPRSIVVFECNKIKLKSKGKKKQK